MLSLSGLAFIPETHVVSAKLQLGKEAQRLHEAADRAHRSGRGTLWIAKPESRNRGIGITVHTSMRMLPASLDTTLCMRTFSLCQEAQLTFQHT